MENIMVCRIMDTHSYFFSAVDTVTFTHLQRFSAPVFERSFEHVESSDVGDPSIDPRQCWMRRVVKPCRLGHSDFAHPLL